MMNKQDFMKQTCVLKVNIQCACEGCDQKIKKLLNNIDGVYRTSIDLEQGKVTVYGDANPATLIKKLNKSGKHAELWGPQRGVNLLNNQFKNIGFDNQNHNRGGGRKDKQKDGKGYQQMQATINKDTMPFNKDQKSVKFNMPVRGGFDNEDDFDDDDDEEDSDSYDGYDEKVSNKTMTRGYGPRGPIAMMNGTKGPNAGFELPVQFKGKGGNNDAKKGDSWKKGGRGGKKSKTGGCFGGKIGRALLGGGKKKHSVSIPKSGKKPGVGGGSRLQMGGSWDKKLGKHLDDEGKFGSSNKQNEFLGFSKTQNGGGGRHMGHNGGFNGGNIGQMSSNPMMARMKNHPTGQMGFYQMGQIPSGQGFPMAYRGQGMDNGNSNNQQQQYQQQQYMPAMMMNHHSANMYPQMMYGQPPPAAYGPPIGRPVNDNMIHIFSDENTEGCSIM